MTPVPPTRKPLQAMALPLAVLALTAWQALPTIFAAWGNDLYARGAPLACAIWLAPQAWWQFKLRPAPAPPCLAWLGLALALCAAGTVTELHAFQHLALVAALAGVLGWRLGGALTSAAAVAWLPASGWFLSHWKTAGLAGWERPALASSLAVCLVLGARFVPASPTVKPPNP